MVFVVFDDDDDDARLPFFPSLSFPSTLTLSLSPETHLRSNLLLSPFSPPLLGILP